MSSDEKTKKENQMQQAASLLAMYACFVCFM